MTRLLLLSPLLASTAFAITLPREQTVEGVRFITHYIEGADDTAPLIVAIHGRGGTPEKLEQVFEAFETRSEIALPQGFDSLDKGWQWFDWPRGTSDEEAGRRMAAAEDRLWKAVVALAKGRKVIVTGFSQGAMLAFTMAARHPNEVLEAVPVAGRMMHSIYPEQKGAPVFAIHGTADKTVEIKFARQAIGAFQAAGTTAELHEVPGADHSFAADVQLLMIAELKRVIESGPIVSASAAEAVVRHFWEAYSRGAWPEIATMVTPDYQHHASGKALTSASISTLQSPSVLWSVPGPSLYCARVSALPEAWCW
jgi:predicted esterase